MTSGLMALGVVLALAVLVSACGGEGPSRGVAELAYTRTVGRHPSVWVAKADGSGARQIAARAFAGTLSSDGRSLAYSLAQDASSTGLTPLYVVDLTGGAPRRIGEASDYVWSPDGARLAVSDGRIMLVVDPKSGERQELARGGDPGGLRFAPDGKSLAYQRANGEAGRKYRSDVFVVRLSDRKITQVTHDGHSDTPIWGRGQIVYRSFHFVGDWSIGRLRLVRPDGSGARRFARGEERTSSSHLGLVPLDFSEDGKRLLACAATEFSCSPVTFTMSGREQHTLSVDDDGVTIVQARDLARDGSEVLVDAGAFDDDAHHRIYAIPFEGGTPRLLVRDATSPNWASGQG